VVPSEGDFELHNMEDMVACSEHGGFSTSDNAPASSLPTESVTGRAMQMLIQKQLVKKGQVAVSKSFLSNVNLSLKQIGKAVTDQRAGKGPVLPDVQSMMSGAGIVTSGKFYSSAELAAVPLATMKVLDDGKFGCSDCDKSFVTRVKFQSHLKTHQGLGDYVCPDCGKKYNTRQRLMSHMHTHDEEGRERCGEPGCNKSYATKYGLAKHLDREHLAAGVSAQRFKCDFCDKDYGTKHDCARHSGSCAENPNAKRYPCQWGGCIADFGSLKDRNHHRARMHHMDDVQQV